MLVGNVPIGTCELIEDEPNIVAIKEDFGLDYAHEVLLRWGDRWAMVGGGAMKRHHLLWPHGNCRAWLDVFIRCYPDPCMAYWQALQRGDTRGAWRSVMRDERPLWEQATSARYGFDGFVAHAMLEAFGVAPRWRRSPAPNATDAEMEDLRQFLHGQGWL